MTVFNYTLLVNDPLADIISAPLGADADNPLKDADRGKIVKMNADGNWVLAEEGDDIEGFIVAIEPWTVNDGFSFGSVQRNRRMEAEVGEGQGGTEMAVGDLVVADDQVARGTPGMAQVKTGAAAAQGGAEPFAYTSGTPALFIWRCIRIISGDGEAGDKVLIERI